MKELATSSNIIYNQRWKGRNRVKGLEGRRQGVGGWDVDRSWAYAGAHLNGGWASALGRGLPEGVKSELPGESYSGHGINGGKWKGRGRGEGGPFPFLFPLGFVKRRRSAMAPLPSLVFVAFSASFEGLRLGDPSPRFRLPPSAIADSDPMLPSCWAFGGTLRCVIWCSVTLVSKWGRKLPLCKLSLHRRDWLSACALCRMLSLLRGILAFRVNSSLAIANAVSAFLFSLLCGSWWPALFHDFCSKRGRNFVQSGFFSRLEWIRLRNRTNHHDGNWSRFTALIFNFFSFLFSSSSRNY